MDGVLFLLIGQKTWPEVEWGKCTAMYPCMCFSLGESQLGDGLNFLEAFFRHFPSELVPPFLGCA